MVDPRLEPIHIFSTRSAGLDAVLEESAGEVTSLLMDMRVCRCYVKVGRWEDRHGCHNRWATACDVCVAASYLCM